MAANAYVLVNIEPAMTREVVDRLNSISGAAVREVARPLRRRGRVGGRHRGRHYRDNAAPHPSHQRRYQHRYLPLVHQ